MIIILSAFLFKSRFDTGKVRSFVSWNSNFTLSFSHLDLSLGTIIGLDGPKQYYGKDVYTRGLFPIYSHEDILETVDLASLYGGERTFESEKVSSILTMFSAIAESPLYTYRPDYKLMNCPIIACQIMATCEMIRELLASNVLNGDFDELIVS